MTISGPFAAQATAQAASFLVSLGCTITGNSVTCLISVWEALNFYNSDTGIPTVPGHYNDNSLISIFGPPGSIGQFHVQVTKLS